MLATYISIFVSVYTLLIFARILVSWIPNIPYNRYLSLVIDFVHEVTEPYLSLFRKILPPLNFGGAGIDISPMIAIFTLQLIGALSIQLVR